MKIVERLSVVNTAISFINLCPITLTFLSFLAFEKTKISIIIHSSIILLVFLIHFLIYIIYRFTKSKYYVIDKTFIAIFLDKKQVNYYSFYDISNIEIHKLDSSLNDFTHILYCAMDGEHKIYVNYFQAKKIKKIYDDFFDAIKNTKNNNLSNDSAD